MSVFETVGLVLSGGDALLKLCSTIEQHFKARRELPVVLHDSKARIHRICDSITRYTRGLVKDDVPGTILQRVVSEFDNMKTDLEKLAKKKPTFRFHGHLEKVSLVSKQLATLENQLDMYGLITHESASLREQLIALTDSVRKMGLSLEHPKISDVLKRIDSSMKTPEKSSAYHEAETIPIHARNLLDALSRSGVSNEMKVELSTKARRLWEGWKISMDDIKFLRKPNGDRKRLGKGGTAEVYLAEFCLRDDQGRLLGKKVEVAVKEFNFPIEESGSEFASFIREVFLQKYAQFPSIVQTFGGFWPDVSNIEGNDDDDDCMMPCIVMERMSCNLRQLLGKGLLNSGALKQRVLADIAGAIAHLHDRRIVHRDIKPENVLVRIVDGKFVGRAKVSDFSVSRKAEQTDMVTTSMRTTAGVTGTLAYLPPEAFTDSTKTSANKFSRDVWSFGVLMCEVLEPRFLKNVLENNKSTVTALASSGQLSKSIAESASSKKDTDLGKLALSCLAIDSKARPPMSYVAEALSRDSSQANHFHFVNYLSWDYRAAEVIRYVRQRVARDEGIQDLEAAVSVLQNAVKDGDISAVNMLGYCHYFGVGVSKDHGQASLLFQVGLQQGDPISQFAVGTLLFSEKRFNRAVDLLQKAAKADCPGAMMWLATCFRYGYGVKKDERRAFELTTAAADQGNHDAQAWLASFYRTGTGTCKDGGRALALLHGLSANGNAFAAMWLALWYKQGLAVDADENRAKHFLELARQRGILGSWVFNERKNWWVVSGG